MWDLGSQSHVSPCCDLDRGIKGGYEEQEQNQRADRKRQEKKNACGREGWGEWGRKRRRAESEVYLRGRYSLLS